MVDWVQLIQRFADQLCVLTQNEKNMYFSLSIFQIRFLGTDMYKY